MCLLFSSGTIYDLKKRLKVLFAVSQVHTVSVFQGNRRNFAAIPAPNRSKLRDFFSWNLMKWQSTTVCFFLSLLFFCSVSEINCPLRVTLFLHLTRFFLSSHIDLFTHFLMFLPLYNGYSLSVFSPNYFIFLGYSSAMQTLQKFVDETFQIMVSHKSGKTLMMLNVSDLKRSQNK